jgi:hypothetical protein
MGVSWSIILHLKPDFFFEIRFFLDSFKLLVQYFTVQSKTGFCRKNPVLVAEIMALPQP